MFTNEINIGLLLNMEKTVLVKKKFQVQQSVKKVVMTILGDIKRPFTTDFLEKGATINSSSCYQLLGENSTYSLNDPGKERTVQYDDDNDI